MDNRPIGIFDSGLGGLTCVKEVLRIMPSEDIIYFGDTGRVPYGTRGADTIVKYVRQDINFLKSFDIKYIIIACGTASSAALPNIQGEYDIEISGVLEPAARLAVKATKNNKIGVLGTSGTIKSGKYAEFIENVNPDAKVFQQACPMFVPLVENGYIDSEVTELIASEYLEPMKREKVDTIILGCTHYPLLKPVISRIMGDNVTLIDSGAAAADYAKLRLDELGLSCDKNKKGNVKYFVSDTVESFSELGGLFLNREIQGGVSRIEIEKY